MTLKHGGMMVSHRVPFAGFTFGSNETEKKLKGILATGCSLERAQIRWHARASWNSCIRAGHVSSHRKSMIDFIPQLIDFGITINLTLEFIPSS
jgi:hypothetical protein